MASITHTSPFDNVDEKTYKRRINAWMLYDWANSAFATTIMAAILPAYYSAVAGSTLPSAATATAYWSLTNSLALFIIALLSPVLGTISDILNNKKKFLSFFVGIGVIGTGLLVLINTGDWILASLFFIIGRIGFGGSIIFYDALLPHVARDEDQDWVSSGGFAWGYVGGGILLAVNVVMLQLIPDSLFDYAGIRLSFLSVAIWWAVFSIPLLLRVPEPNIGHKLKGNAENIVKLGFKATFAVFRDIRSYPQLFLYLIAFLIYSDAINTIIGVAVIYGAELGFETLELVLALLLVQFVGIPFTLIFGNLPSKQEKRRHYYLAFVVFNAIALPIGGYIASQTLDASITGTPPAPYVSQNGFYGEGNYDSSSFTTTGEWQTLTISPEEQVSRGIMGQLTLLFSPPAESQYLQATSPNAQIDFPINGKRFNVEYATDVNGGAVDILVDGVPLVETADDGSLLVPTLIMQDDLRRYGESAEYTLATEGQHTISFVSRDDKPVSISRIKVLPPLRSSSLPTIFAILMGTQVVGIVFALLTGNLFKPYSDRLDTRNSILLSLVIYGIISVWGYFLNATIEFWFLAWMVGIVQGGSQALSRSLYSHMCPATKSGKFFGLFSIMSKFASIIGPLLFALAVALFGSSRPAILSLIALFFIGGYLLTRVNIEEGFRQANEEDQRFYREQGA